MDFFSNYRKEELLQALDELNWYKASKIQEKVLSLFIENPVNILMQSQCGSGKTVALALAMLHRLEVGLNHLQIVYICANADVSSKVASLIETLTPKVKIGIATSECEGLI